MYGHLARRMAGKSTSNALKSSISIAVSAQIARLTGTSFNLYLLIFGFHKSQLDLTMNVSISQSPALPGNKEMWVRRCIRTPVNVALRRRSMSCFFKKTFALLFIFLLFWLFSVPPLLLIQVVESLNSCLPAHHPHLPLTPLPQHEMGESKTLMKSQIPHFLSFLEKKIYFSLMFGNCCSAQYAKAEEPEESGLFSKASLSEAASVKGSWLEMCGLWECVLFPKPAFQV